MSRSPSSSARSWRGVWCLLLSMPSLAILVRVAQMFATHQTLDANTIGGYLLFALLSLGSSILAVIVGFRSIEHDSSPFSSWGLLLAAICLILEFTLVVFLFYGYQVAHFFAPGAHFV